MEFSLTDQQLLIQKTVREFAEREITPIAAKLDEQGHAGHFPMETVQKMAALGLLGAQLPPEYGGSGLDTISYAIAVEEIARASGGIALIMAAHNSLASGHIKINGTDAQRKHYLPKMATAEWLGTWCLTEPNGGSDAATMDCVAKREGDGWTINGTKIFATNGDVAQVAVVMASTDRAGGQKSGVTAFIVERGTKGYQVGVHEQKMGCRASTTTEIHFQDCWVPAQQVVGDEVGKGFIQALKVLDGGRISIAAMAIGLAAGALDLAVKYAQERTQFGQPIGKFQAVQWMIADSATEVEAARLLTYRAAYLKDLGHRTTKESSMAKLFASEVSSRVTNKAVQIHGGLGYTLDSPVERMLRDAKLTEIGEGTSEIQRLVIARQILKNLATN